MGDLSLNCGTKSEIRRSKAEIRGAKVFAGKQDSKTLEPTKPVSDFFSAFGFYTAAGAGLPKPPGNFGGDGLPGISGSGVAACAP